MGTTSGVRFANSSSALLLHAWTGHVGAATARAKRSSLIDTAARATERRANTMLLLLICPEQGRTRSLTAQSSRKRSRDVGGGGDSLCPDLHDEIVRVGEEVVEPGWVLVCACGGRENVDTLGVALVGEVHHRVHAG